ncbi:MAG TPA: M24 family metallopeptidase [Bryobacteraceae bacterium]|nr:M24 family metallopeptidase [Bryobacteraceae bacterium]
MRSLRLCLALVCSTALFCADATVSLDHKLLPSSLREQADLQQAWLKQRLDNNLPALMRKHGVGMWIVACREYAEDPAFFSLVSPTVFAARRTTIYVFNDRGVAGGVERLALGGDSNGDLYTVYRDPAAPAHELYGDSQWQTLRKLVDSRNPKNIAIDVSATHAFSDGLTAGIHDKLLEVLGTGNAKRVVRAENLALEYQELRVPEMLPSYREMMRVVHSLISRAFSNEVITPGKTTDQDVVWWLRQKVNDLGYGTWFQPSVMVQRAGVRQGLDFLHKENGIIIERGDVLHTDFGITAMRLNTDTQHMGYVLRPGETDVPAGLKHALQTGNRLQDIVLERLRPGRTGNEILKESLAAMQASGIKGTVYSHPIGDHGHAAGPLIGLWDHQEGVPGRGDVKVLPMSWFSIELSAWAPVPEWNNQEVQMGLEEDASVDARGHASWVLSRQTEFHVVR